jgi:hypothetical protein
METPIILTDANKDLYCFKSVSECAKYVEPIDVRNGEYVAYDGNGYLLRLVLRKGKVAIEPVADAGCKASDLMRLLKDQLADISCDKEWLANASLAELVQKRLEYRSVL